MREKVGRRVKRVLMSMLLTPLKQTIQFKKREKEWRNKGGGVWRKFAPAQAVQERHIAIDDNDSYYISLPSRHFLDYYTKASYNFSLIDFFSLSLSLSLSAPSHPIHPIRARSHPPITPFLLQPTSYNQNGWTTWKMLNKRKDKRRIKKKEEHLKMNIKSWWIDCQTIKILFSSFIWIRHTHTHTHSRQFLVGGPYPPAPAPGDRSSTEFWTENIDRSSSS